MLDTRSGGSYPSLPAPWLALADDWRRRRGRGRNGRGMGRLLLALALTIAGLGLAEGSAWRVAAQDSSAQVVIERPLPGTTVSLTTNISGWAVDPTGPG